MTKIAKVLNGHWKLIATSVITLSIAAIPTLQGYSVLQSDVKYISGAVSDHCKEDWVRDEKAATERRILDKAAIENKTLLTVIMTEQSLIRKDIKDFNADRNKDMAEIRAILVNRNP